MLRAASVFLLLAAPVFGGEATVTDSFVLDAPYEKVVAWLDTNQPKVRSAINVELVSDQDGVLKLRRANRRGEWIWWQDDVITQRNGEWKLNSRLVETVEGGLEHFESEVILVSSGGKTAISATSTARVAEASDREIRTDLHGRARRIRELLEKELR